MVQQKVAPRNQEIICNCLLKLPTEEMLCNNTDAIRSKLINSMQPGDAYMRHWTGSSLVQEMACHLFGTKPSPEPMLTYCQIYLYHQTSIRLELKVKYFTLKKITFQNVPSNVAAILFQSKCDKEQNAWHIFPSFMVQIIMCQREITDVMPFFMHSSYQSIAVTH